MGAYNFNTTVGQTVARELLIAYLNTGTYASPVWKPIGKRVEDSSADYDWGEESSQDILGNTNNSMKKPVISQTFDPCKLEAGDEAQLKIWNLAIVDQDAQALSAQDMLIVHYYAGFAERYPACMVKPSSIGGEGGGSVGMPLDVTYGGARVIGTASKASDGSVAFTPETSRASIPYMRKPTVSNVDDNDKENKSIIENDNEQSLS